MKYLIKGILPFLFITIFFVGYSQDIPVHISSTKVYSFLDELANEKIISINSNIKPYYRKQIIQWLQTADSAREKLSARQQKELDRYLLEFTGSNASKPLKEKARWQLLAPAFSYYKRNSSIIIRPLYDFNYWVYKNGRPLYQTNGGAELLLNKGIVSAYARLREQHYHGDILKRPTFLTSYTGGNYKVIEGGYKGGDFSEMQGGIFINWKWGHFGICKDHVAWGDEQFGGLIFSGQTPSFPMISLQAQPFKWMDINYFHGWLVSEVIDSSSSYFSQPGMYRGVFQPKYIAANMFTFRPWKFLNVSIGNSIIYSDMPVQLVYLIPILFYKSVDHTINHNIDNQNSQMFLNISSRNLKHVHFYGSVFFDEFSIKRITDPDRYNFFGFKLGGTLSNWPVKNLAVDIENTTIFPMVYKHRVASLTYTSNKYNLGYYMGDNSMDYQFRIRYKPYAFLSASIGYSYSIHGNEYEYILNDNIDRHPLIADKTWDRHIINATVSYIPFTEFEVFLSGIYSNTNGYPADGNNGDYYLNLYSPAVFQGKNLFLSTGLKLGL